MQNFINPCIAQSHNHNPSIKSAAPHLSDLSFLPQLLRIRQTIQHPFLVVCATIAPLFILESGSKVYAAGGAYVVDDGSINSPGECNIDLWYRSQRHKQSTYQTHVSQDCTLKAFPSLQLGAEVSHSHEPDATETLLSPKVKAQVYNDEQQGLEIALAGEMHFSYNHRHAFNGADVIVPITYKLSDPLKLNVNSGWGHKYENGDHSDHWIWGVGFEYEMAESVSVIAERFGESGGDQGWQAGPRITISKWLDLDLLFGQHLNNEREQWVGIGGSVSF